MIQVHTPQLVRDTNWDFSSEKTPALAMLKELLRLGWQAASPIATLTSEPPRHFCPQHAMRNKPLLLCLLAFGELVLRGLTELSMTQCQEYYRALLASETPAAVPLGKNPEFYASRSQAKEDPALTCDRGGLESEDEGAQPALLRSFVIPNELVEGQEDDEPTFSQRRPRRRGGESSAATRTTLTELLGADFETFNAPSGTQRDAVGGGEAEAAVCSLPLAAPNAGSGSSVLPAAEVPPQRVSSSFTLPNDEHPYVGNLSVRVETRIAPTYHKRYMLQCPCSLGPDAIHPRCSKSRTAGPSATRVWGEVEPFAFLGVWASKAPEFADRQSHISYTPTDADIAAFVKEHGWQPR